MRPDSRRQQPPPGRATPRIRWLRPTALLSVAVALAGLATGCTGSAAPLAGDAAKTIADPAPRDGCLPAGESLASTRGPYAVGRIEVTLVDDSRPTAARPGRQISAQPNRTLPTVILYPAEGDEVAGPPTRAAPPAAGAFPLIVVSHGVDSDGSAMAGKAESWVRAGYIVAAPTFPLSSGPGADITDLANQPGDVRFVTDSVRSIGDDPTQPLKDHLAADCLALAGHSMGAATTLEATYESTYRVPGVDAAIEMSGILAAMPGGSFADAPAIPLLLLHGDADPVVPVTASAAAFDQLPGPNYFIAFRGFDHNSIFAPPAKALLDQTAIAFLDAELKGAEPPSGPLASLVNGSDVATLRVKEG
jgi:dienelactone hydrolase